jgi:hypothetical protein
MATEASTGSTVAGKSKARSRLIAIGIAVVAAVAVWGIGTAAGARMEVDQGAGVMAVPVIAVIATVLVVGFAGWGLLALLTRRNPRGVRTWTIIALVVLALSFFPVLASEATTGTRFTLAGMHLVVGAVVISLFRRGAHA